MYDFKYHRPASAADAVAACKAAADGVYLAGGMTLLPTMKQRLARSSDVVDLAAAGLAGVSRDGDAVTVGAMSTHGSVANSSEVQSAIPALGILAGGIGDPQVRNRGTIGGSIANADPAADYPAAVLGLGAVVHTDRRAIGADEFFTGMFETALDDGELITKVVFPVPAAAAYAKFANPASRYAVVGVMAAKTGGGIRVAVTGAAAAAFRATAMEEALAKDFSPAALDGISVDADYNSDIHASAEYRRHLVGVMAKRAVREIA